MMNKINLIRLLIFSSLFTSTPMFASTNEGVFEFEVNATSKTSIEPFQNNLETKIFGKLEITNTKSGLLFNSSKLNFLFPDEFAPIKVEKKLPNGLLLIEAENINIQFEKTKYKSAFNEWALKNLMRFLLRGLSELKFENAKVFCKNDNNCKHSQNIFTIKTIESGKLTEIVSSQTYNQFDFKLNSLTNNTTSLPSNLNLETSSQLQNLKMPIEVKNELDLLKYKKINTKLVLEKIIKNPTTEDLKNIELIFKFDKNPIKLFENIAKNNRISKITKLKVIEKFFNNESKIIENYFLKIFNTPDQKILNQFDREEFKIFLMQLFAFNETKTQFNQLFFSDLNKYAIQDIYKSRQAFTFYAMWARIYRLNTDLIDPESKTLSNLINQYKVSTILDEKNKILSILGNTGSSKILDLFLNNPIDCNTNKEICNRFIYSLRFIKNLDQEIFDITKSLILKNESFVESAFQLYKFKFSEGYRMNLLNKGEVIKILNSKEDDLSKQFIKLIQEN